MPARKSVPSRKSTVKDSQIPERRGLIPDSYTLAIIGYAKSQKSDFLEESLTPDMRDVLYCLEHGESYKNAAALSGISRVQIALWRKTVPAFDDCLSLLRDIQVEDLEDDLWTRTAADDKLLTMFALKGKRPEYRDNQAPAGPDRDIKVIVQIGDSVISPDLGRLLPGQAAARLAGGDDDDDSGLDDDQDQDG